MKTLIKALLTTGFSWLQKKPRIGNLLLSIFYIVRFVFFAIKERSGLFCRYYPGYHGSTIPSYKQLQPEIASKRIYIEPGKDGIDLNISHQLAFLEALPKYYQTFQPAKEKTEGKLYYANNTMFGFNDAFYLYAMMSHYRPACIVELGSGFSSALMLDTNAELKNNIELKFIDPYSTTIASVLENHPQGNYQLIRQPAQDTPDAFYQSLQENDILFIDTSHALKIGSDLSSIFFRILPLLNKGVIVHIHDVWHPWEYPEKMIAEGRTYNEIYFVRAFLQYNRAFEILFFASHMEETQRDFYQAHLPRCINGERTGSSLWLRKIA